MKESLESLQYWSWNARRKKMKVKIKFCILFLSQTRKEKGESERKGENVTLVCTNYDLMPLLKKENIL
jgi:hypothetical protein